MAANFSILERIQDRLDAHDLEVDARKVATVIMELAREAGWASKPDALIPWLSQLAIEVAHPPKLNEADGPR